MSRYGEDCRYSRERSYPITIASGLFNEPASFLPLKSGEQVMLVTNETLAPLYLDKVRGVLEQAGVNVDSVILLTASSIKTWLYSIPSLRRCYKNRMVAILRWWRLAAA